MKISNNFKLIFGLVSLPVFFWLYTSNSLPRIRCHLPSWQSGHFAFELTPYIFSAVCILFTGMFCKKALTATGNASENFLALSFAFLLNVTAFSLVYYSYGVQEDTRFSVSLPIKFDDITQIHLELDGREQSWEFSSAITDVQRGEGSEGKQPVVIPQVIETRVEMVDNPLDYFLYSASIAIPGGTFRQVSVCPSAQLFLPIQNLLGLVVSLMFAAFSARITRTLNKPTN